MKEGKRVLLRQLLHALPDARLSRSAEIDILDLAYDSRRVTPGALFVAVPSVGGDASSGGVQYVGEAIRRGAVAIVAPLPMDELAVPVAVVPDARSALADLAAAFFDHPSRDLALFAVTGTDGKTTTSCLLEQILAFAGARTGLIGTVEIKIGDERHFNADRMTTPESLDLQRLLAQMRAADVTHVALEASSHALALQRLRGLTFAACALTNVTADHLEFHGSWDAYFDAKASLFRALGPRETAVLNQDDASFERLAAGLACSVLAYGIETEAELRARDLQLGLTATTCTIALGERETRTTVPLPGRYNVANALAAAGLASVAGLDLDTICRGMTGARPPTGRMERVSSDSGLEVVVDYAHTPNAFRSVLTTVREVTGRDRRVIAVFGAAGNRDRAKRPLLARIAREHADYFIITNEDPFGEPPERIMAEIASGVDAAEEGRRFELEPDRERAIRRAIDLAHPGDVVLILGKGHEQSMVAGVRKEPWSDLLVAREAVGSAV